METTLQDESCSFDDVGPLPRCRAPLSTGREGLWTLEALSGEGGALVTGGRLGRTLTLSPRERGLGDMPVCLSASLPWGGAAEVGRRVA
jgi:hypothetical protein